MMKIPGVTVLALLIAGCATGYQPTHSYNQLQVINLTGGEIRDVSLRVVGTGRSLSCEQVAKNAICDDRFGYRRYPKQGLDLSWVHPDGSRKTESVAPSVPAYFFGSLPLQVFIEVREDGSLRPFYKQEDPGRNGGSLFSS